MQSCFEVGRPVPAKGVGYGLARTRFSCFLLVVRLLATGYPAAAPLPISSQNPDLVLIGWYWRNLMSDRKLLTKNVDATFLTQNVPGSMWRQVSQKKIQLFPKCDDIPETCTNVTISAYCHNIFLGSKGFDQTWVWKHCQILGSRCRAPRFWLGTNLIFLLYYWSQVQHDCCIWIVI